MAEQVNKFKIQSFVSGINQSVNENLIRPYEAVSAKNANISDGTIKTFCEPELIKSFGGRIHSFLAYYGVTSASNKRFVGISTGLINYDNLSALYTISGNMLDSVNFQYNADRIMIMTSKDDTPFYYNGSEFKKLLNRRKVFDDNGNLTGYVDANGVSKTNESDVTTYAPKGDFIELYYDRVWIAGDTTNPDRLYFSTANVYGADIQDFTAPTEEAEANQHGGFIDVRTYDGSKIIGLKTVFNNLVVFKNKSAQKVFGSSPSNFQMVQLFSCNGAIADKSIVIGNNGAFFLNSDGIYFYDGTNTNLISDKIKNIISSMALNYAEKAVGTFYNGSYYLAIPYNGSSVNNLLVEYNTRTRGFMIYDIPDVTQMMVYEDILFITSNNSVKKLLTGTTGKQMYWESPSLDFQSKDSKKNTGYLYFLGKGSGDVKFSLVTERATKSVQVTLDGTLKPYKKKLKNKGRTLKLIIENVNNSVVQVVSPELLFEVDYD